MCLGTGSEGLCVMLTRTPGNSISREGSKEMFGHRASLKGVCMNGNGDECSSVANTEVCLLFGDPNRRAGK